MVYSPQSHSTTPTRHGAAVMNSENQNAIPNRRPIANTTIQSPKWAGSGNGTASIMAPVAINGSSNRRREGRLDGPGVDNEHSPEDVGTPVKAFLSSNITPRSSSRKARVESASSTPNGISNGTPHNSRSISSIERRESASEDRRATSRLGLRISTPGRRSRTSSVISDSLGSSISSRPPLLERKDSATRTATPEISPKFVYANDIKASIPAKPTASRSLPKAHLAGIGQSNDGSSSNGRDSSMSSSPTLDEQLPKFFYASGTPNDSKPPPRLSNGISSQRPPLQTIYSAHTASSPPRAASPLKEEVLPRKSSVNKPSPRRHTRLVSNGGTEIKPPETFSGNTDIGRRSSLNSPRQSSRQAGIGSHSRSSSVQSAGPSPRRRSSIALSNTSPTAAERNRTTSMAGSNGALPHSVNPPAVTQELPSTQLPAQPQSPTRPLAVGQSKIDQMNELAAKARRERKVLDLEISNSSLLAINRTLEREMRKQTAELRRYRRLSRSGRLSVAPTSRSASGKMSLLSESAQDSADETSPSDSDNEENDHDEDILSHISSPSATSSHPSSPTSRAGRTRFRDPKQPKLDLAAHRALLLDGQKLNQSIKRCLTQSESLIASAKTALAYQARAPTTENIGGRVLTPDDNEDQVFGQGQGLLSPSPFTDGNPFERGPGSTHDLEGGLETPDYSKWGPPTEVQTPFAEIGELMASDKLDGSTVMDILDGLEKNEDYGIDAVATDLLNGEQALKDKPNPNESHSDSEISIDGIDDSLDDSSLDDEPHGQESPSLKAIPLRPAPEEKDLSRPSSPSRILNAIRPPDPKPDIAGNVPGNRGSMQNLGHYLQAFSIFGAGQSQA